MRLDSLLQSSRPVSSPLRWKVVVCFLPVWVLMVMVTPVAPKTEQHDCSPVDVATAPHSGTRPDFLSLGLNVLSSPQTKKSCLLPLPLSFTQGWPPSVPVHPGRTHRGLFPKNCEFCEKLALWETLRVPEDTSQGTSLASHSALRDPLCQQASCQLDTSQVHLSLG